MTDKSLIARAVACLLAAAALAYMIYLREAWLDAALAAAAMALLLAPLLQWRERCFVLDLAGKHRVDLRAQMISSNEMLRLTRERDHEHIDALNRQYARLADEVATLHGKLALIPQRDQRGRFVKSKQLLIDHLDVHHVQAGIDHAERIGGGLA